MRVLALELTDFRNLANVTLSPHVRFNLVYGDNGQGKSNLLEAIYLLATLRSFRALRIEELVRFDQPRARLRARVAKLGTERLLEIELAAGQRTARVDGKAARSTEYFGGFNVVLFTPDDLRLPRGAPKLRRRFLDRAVWNAVPAYLPEAQRYERILRSRNALLRQPGGPAPELLEVYDAQLADAAVPITMRRRQLLAELGPLVAEAFERITRSGLELKLGYETSLPAEEAAVAPELAARLAAERRRDLQRQLTSSGPHADDLTFSLDGRPVRLYASQGQTRAVVLALKTAEIEYLSAKISDAPVLLLDDVSSELDPQRSAQLFDFLASIDGQTFLTSTHLSNLAVPEIRKQFNVVKGDISE